MNHQDMDRREFIRRTGHRAALTGFGIAMAQRPARASERIDPRAPKTGRLLNEGEIIGIGVIGLGAMGGSHAGDLIERERRGEKVQVRGVSDVYMRRAKNTQQRFKRALGRDVEFTFDYKKLLARDDIHGVIIATPDHWHAQMSIDAMNAGKDVYCQKPMTLTIDEALEVRDTAYATGRVFQCGAQRCSDDYYWQARDFIRRGALGKIVWTQADYGRNSAGGPNDRGGEWNYHIDADASPDPKAGDAFVDWDRFLGPARKRPFSRARFFQFRKYWDYSGGIATDLMYHVVAPLTIAMDLSAPERVSAAGGIYVQHDDREVPDTFMATCDYPEDVTLVLTSSMANRQVTPIMIRGHKATIRLEKDLAMRVIAEDEFKAWFKKEFGSEELVVERAPREDHLTNWLNAMRSRGPVHCDAETACRAMIAVRLACDSWRSDEMVFWDNARERPTRKHPRPNRSSRWPQEPEPTA
jgi:predicted dehydrogenase